MSGAVESESLSLREQETRANHFMDACAYARAAGASPRQAQAIAERLFEEFRGELVDVDLMRRVLARIEELVEQGYDAGA